MYLYISICVYRILVTKDPYEVLGIKRGDSLDGILAARHSLELAWCQIIIACLGWTVDKCVCQCRGGTWGDYKTLPSSKTLSKALLCDFATIES